MYSFMLPVAIPEPLSLSPVFTTYLIHISNSWSKLSSLSPYPAPAKMAEKAIETMGCGKPGALRKDAGTVAKSNKLSVLYHRLDHLYY